MMTNISHVNPNVTLQVIDFINQNISTVNESEMIQKHLLAYKTVEKEQLMVFKFVIYFVGPLIILSNLTVVISSGLILKNGLQPKSTYLLLGNVSMADMIIGLCLIFKVTVDNPISSNLLCTFQMGLLIGPSFVSCYSIGLIAIDRYIYILYGLYYKMWINTTRVRIAILIIWIIGITIGFMPVTGLVNSDLINSSCSYVNLYPGGFIIVNTLINMVPITVIVILYSKILIQALKIVKDLNTSVKTTKHSDKVPDNSNIISCGTETELTTTSISQSIEIPKITHSLNTAISSSISDSNNPEEESAIQPANTDNKAIITNIDGIRMERMSKPACDSTISDSTISICTMETEISDNNSESENIPKHENSRSSIPVKKVDNINKVVLKPSAPNKWRAITIVLVTSGSFILTCMPFLITVLFYVFCDEKITNARCLYIRYILGGPFSALVFVNCMLNPLIYAWWHKGFRKFIKKSFRKCIIKKK